jgi:hypothetical protein
VTVGGTILAAALSVWSLDADRVIGAPERPLRVGSLMKPFVAEAWTRAHQGGSPPRVRCDAASHCWLATGHGELGLARALTLSCNTYFLALARDTPDAELAATLRAAGFAVPARLRPEAAIGLDDEAPALVSPGDLLRAYVRLTREPWPEAEDVRASVLAGLRESPVRGTARGLGLSGYWAKTGTIAAENGVPWRTDGLALAVDDAGKAMLLLRPKATGRDAALALGRRLAGRDGRSALPAPRPSGTTASAPVRTDRVTVALFTNLRPREVVARNVSGRPLPTSRGYVGPGGAVTLLAGDRLGDGVWSLSLPGRAGFRREIAGAVSGDAGPDGRLEVRAEVERREYVAGVIRAELGEGDPDAGLSIALGAAVLRFLGDGPRHADAEVCDSTHCAWFVGRGPLARWTGPERAVLLANPRPATEPDPGLSPSLFARIVAEAAGPGPRQWSSDCGGAPLSAHEVWGNGDRQVWRCATHPTPESRWERTWPDAAVARAFGGPVRGLAVRRVDDVWVLEVDTARGRQAIRYDDAHRRLAAELGWGALPSPAFLVARSAGGWRAVGVGLGHRVGLCLGRGTQAGAPDELDFGR